MFSKFSKNIAPYVESEINLAEAARSVGAQSLAFQHLENAHVIGQESTYWHVKVHVLMLQWAVQNSMLREIIGQFLRVIGAAIMTPVCLVPLGNTGGSNVSPFESMPIGREHTLMIRSAKDKV